MNYEIKTFLDLSAFLEHAYPIKSYLRQILRYSPDLRCHLDIVKMAACSLSDGARVLDLGAGGLDKVLPLAAQGFECVAFDDFGDPWHKSACGAIADLAREYNVSLVEGSLRALSAEWPLGNYDMIMLNDVIEHLSFSPLPLIDQCLKHLNTGGILLINVPSCVNIKKRVKCLLGLSIYPPADQFFLSEGDFRGHIREYSRRDLEFIARNLSGVRLYEIKSVSHMIGVIPGSLRFLARFVFFLFPSFSDSWQLILRK